MSNNAKNVVIFDIDKSEYSVRPFVSAEVVGNYIVISGTTEFQLFEGATLAIKLTGDLITPTPIIRFGVDGNNTPIRTHIENYDYSFVGGKVYEFIYDGTYWNLLTDNNIREASELSYGGIKVKEKLDREILTENIDGKSPRYYGIDIDSTGKAIVNVPKESIDYNFGTGINQDGSSIQVKTDESSISANSTTGAIQIGTDCTWVNTGSNLSNMNNFIANGIYNISGERTRTDDNMPIINNGGGHTFTGRLYVYNSSLSNGTGANKDICVTQVFSLSNRVGGDGNVYVRTGTGASIGANLSWSPWGKLQTNFEVGKTSSLDYYVDNGMYSGAYLTDTNVETFILIVLNNYAAVAEVNAAGGSYPAQCTQLKYSICVGGEIKLNKRLGTRSGTGTWSWGNWDSIGDTIITGGGNGEVQEYELPLAAPDERGGIRIGATSQPSNKRWGVSLNANEQAYVELTTPTSSNFGVIKAQTRNQSITVQTPSTIGDRYYAVEVDSTGKAFVNIPWEKGSSESGSGSTTVEYKGLPIDNTNASIVDYTCTVSALQSGYVRHINLTTSASNIKTFTINGFSEPIANVVNTYGLLLNITANFGQPIKLSFPSGINVKWSNGIQPFLIGNEIVEIIFTNIGANTYIATWVKYFDTDDDN